MKMAKGKSGLNQQ